jgi:hypothetical protein
MIPDIKERAVKALDDKDLSVSSASLHLLYDLILVSMSLSAMFLYYYQVHTVSLVLHNSSQLLPNFPLCLYQAWKRGKTFSIEAIEDIFL